MVYERDLRVTPLSNCRQSFYLSGIQHKKNVGTLADAHIERTLLHLRPLFDFIQE